MATTIEMPKLTDTMEEGVLSAWLVDEGDAVSSGDVIAQVETDKATMDVEAFDEGVLLKRMVEEGDAVPIGSLIAVLGEEGEDISDLVGGDGAPAEADEEPEAEPTAEAEDAGAQEDKEATPVSGDGQVTERVPSHVPAGETPSGERIKASPLARRIAQDHGLDLATVEGTGPQGRIVKRDVEDALVRREEAPAPPEAEPAAEPSGTPSGDGAAREPAYQRPSEVVSMGDETLYDAEPISQMRKAISRRLSQSKYTAPHFYLTKDLDMAAVVKLRKELNAMAEAKGRARISFNDFITKACALALREHPMVNAAYLDGEGEIRKYNAVHVGIAVAIEAGLITPVIRHADRKGLTQIAAETKELAERARDKKLQPDEFEGATFTTSNLGGFGIEEFTAIINPPNAAILAIGTIRDTPVVEDGEVVPGKRMRVNLSCDHRVVDGLVGARFLETVQGYLEAPMSMLL